MSLKSVLKIILSGVLIFMCWEIVDTSLKSNLFTEFPTLIKIPWMEATLYDFYTNVLVISFWVAHKETSLSKRVLWIMLLIAMGSVATCIYVLKELYALKEGEGLDVLLTRRNQHL